jgi:hypothetical protein
MSPLESLVARIRGEYREMPGLRLTFAQACRLWQVDASTCEAVLHTLLKEDFLTRTKDGAFVAQSVSGPRFTQINTAMGPDPAIHSHLRRSA